MCEHKFLDSLNTKCQLTNKFRLEYRDAFLTEKILVQRIMISKNMVIGNFYHIKLMFQNHYAEFEIDRTTLKI